jgi:hypothetical protein
LKSIGATRGAVLAQFLLEAMAIVTAGTGDIHLQISGFAVVVSTVVLEAVGLIAGFCRH